MSVDGHAVRVRLDADSLEADPAHPRAPAGGDEQPVAAQLAPVVDLERRSPRRRAVRAVALADRTSSMPSRRSDLAERLAERRRLAREHALGHLDDRHLAAESVNGLGHLHAGRPATEDQQPARDRLHPRRLAVAPDAVELAQARNGRHDRIGAVREHHVLGGVPHAVDFDDAWARRAGRVPRSRSMP